MSDIYDSLKDNIDRIADTINPDTANPMLSNLDRIANALNTESVNPMESNLDKIAYAVENGYSGGGGGVAYKSVFGPITDEVQPSGGYYIIENYDADVIANNDVFILEMNLNTPLVLNKVSDSVLRDSANKNNIYIEDEAVAIQLDPTYGPYDYPSSYIFLYAPYFTESEEEGGTE